MDEVALSIEFPLDVDGFLRRACPLCELDFKWRPSEDDSESPVPEYHCPYCGWRAAADEWNTAAQMEHVQNVVVAEVVAPSLDGLDQALKGLERTSGGLITARLEKPEPTHAPLVFEPGDMRRIDFSCHPAEPLKVAEEWVDPIHCLVCGATR